MSQAVRAEPALQPGAIQRTIPVEVRQQSSMPVESSIQPHQDQILDHRRFVLGAVNIVGATIFSEEQLSRYFEPYLATEVDQSKLVQVAEAITARYQKTGYLLSYATVPAQDVQAGMVRIAVVEGRIGSVSVSGGGSADALIKRMASPLVRKQPLKKSTLERTVGLIRDLPGFQVTDIALVRSDIESRLYTIRITVVPRRLHAFTYVDNRGMNTAAGLRIYHSLSLAIRGNELRLDLFSTPGKRSRDLYGQAFGTFPLGRSGMRLTLSIARGSQHVSAQQQIDEHTENMTAQLTWPLLRSPRLTIVGEASIDDWRISGSTWGGRLQRDRLRVARTGVVFKNEGKIHFEGELLLSRGLDFTGMTKPDDVRSSRIGASGRFTKAVLTIQFTAPLSDVVTFRANAVGQYSDRPLLSLEQYALGGNRIGRAFQFNELTGDRGFGAGTEISYRLRAPPKPLRGLEAFAFVNGGVARHLQTPVGLGGKSSLSSAGVGIRFNLAGGSVALEAAVPLSSPGHRSPRLFVSAFRSF